MHGSVPSPTSWLATLRSSTPVVAFLIQQKAEELGVNQEIVNACFNYVNQRRGAMSELRKSWFLLPLPTACFVL
jgi:hypothetical protein